MLMTDYPDTFISVSIYVWNPPYDTPWANDERAGFYGVLGVPNVWFDGLAQIVGTENSDQATYDEYLGVVTTRWNKPTDVTIDLSVTEVAAQTYRVSATVGIESGGVGKDMVVHFLQTLDDYPSAADGSNHNTARQHDEITVSLTPGETTAVDSVDFLIEGVDWDNQEDVKFIVWAQDVGASGPAEVHQAAQHDLSSDPVPGDVNGDGVVDLSDLAQLLAAFGTCTGHPDYDPDADLNEDGCVELGDLATVLANFEGA